MLRFFCCWLSAVSLTPPPRALYFLLLLMFLLLNFCHQLGKIFDEVDKDKSGSVDQEEFVRFCVQYPATLNM